MDFLHVDGIVSETLQLIVQKEDEIHFLTNHHFISVQRESLTVIIDDPDKGDGFIVDRKIVFKTDDYKVHQVIVKKNCLFSRDQACSTIRNLDKKIFISSLKIDLIDYMYLISLSIIFFLILFVLIFIYTNDK